MLKRESKLPKIPDDAIVQYLVPTWQAGKNNSPSQCISLPTEEKAREYAASGMSNGSGHILKRTSFYTYYLNGSVSGSAKVTLDEELKPVTNFDETGQNRHRNYLELINCKHSNTRSVMEGAGCSKDYSIFCRDCGDLVG